MKAALVSLLLAFLSAGNARAEIDGKFTIALVDREDQETIIGEVSFSPANEFTSFHLDLDSQVFNDHFLSMRPFRCIEGPESWACHLPYPYDSRQLIAPGDLVDLEYALLFIAKTPKEFGIDAWNGRYYKLELIDDDGAGGVLMEGALHEVDLNLLASPPEGAYARPIASKHLTEADAASHRFPKLRIR